MRAEPIASGGMTPLPPLMTVHPMVRTRKKVPINSTTYLFIAALTPAKASGKLRATLKHARIVEDTGVEASHARVAVQGFQPAVRFFEIQIATECDTLQVYEHRKVVIKMLQIREQIE